MEQQTPTVIPLGIVRRFFTIFVLAIIFWLASGQACRALGLGIAVNIPFAEIVTEFDESITIEDGDWDDLPRQERIALFAELIATLASEPEFGAPFRTQQAMLYYMGAALLLVLAFLIKLTVESTIVLTFNDFTHPALSEYNLGQALGITARKFVFILILQAFAALPYLILIFLPLAVFSSLIEVAETPTQFVNLMLNSRELELVVGGSIAAILLIAIPVATFRQLTLRALLLEDVNIYSAVGLAVRGFFRKPHVVLLAILIRAGIAIGSTLLYMLVGQLCIGGLFAIFLGVLLSLVVIAGWTQVWRMISPAQPSYPEVE